MVSSSVIKFFPTHSLTYCLVCAGEMEVVQSPERYPVLFRRLSRYHRLRRPRLIHRHVSGIQSGRLTFPVEVSEEKECECVSLVCGTWSYEDCNFQDAPIQSTYACQASM